MQYRDYPQYLQSAHWRDTRTKIFARDDYKCVLCTKKADEVHHINYRNWYDVLDTDLISLCEGCHCRVHLAIDAGYIQQNDRCSMAKTVDGLDRFEKGKGLSKEDRKERSHFVLGKHLCKSLDDIPSHKQYLVAGVVKRPRPKSFLEWEGLVVSKKTFNRILVLKKPGPKPEVPEVDIPKNKNLFKAKFMENVAAKILKGEPIHPRTIKLCNKYRITLDRKGVSYPRQIIFSNSKKLSVPSRDHLAGGESHQPSTQKVVESVSSKVNCEALPPSVTSENQNHHQALST
jgi:hypothetical protein